MSNAILTKQVEDIVGLPVSREIGTGPRASNGAAYVTLVAGGIKPQGYPFPTGWQETKEAAHELFLQSVRKYAEGKSGMLYWRRFPEFVESGEYDDGQGFQVSCRLVVA